MEIDCDPLLEEVELDCSVKAYSDTASKSPVSATRPNGERSSSGYETEWNDNPSATAGLTVDRSGRTVDKPAVTGPKTEGALITQGRERRGLQDREENVGEI